VLEPTEGTLGRHWKSPRKHRTPQGLGRSRKFWEIFLDLVWDEDDDFDDE
jgi:hypothetical protein